MYFYGNKVTEAARRNMSLRFYWMYVTFTHGTQILGIELDLVVLFYVYMTPFHFNIPCIDCSEYEVKDKLNENLNNNDDSDMEVGRGALD